MANIYLSSTFSDLEDYRAAIYRILRMLGHNVIAMEDYVATDQRPLDKCLADVASCDLCVGVIAWRYGYIPDTNNPGKKSITELEYRQANTSGIAPLMFLLDDQVKWSKKWKDSEQADGDKGKRIADFRAELERDRMVSHFKNPDHLAALVSVAVQKQATPRGLGGSALLQIKRKSLDSRIQTLLEQYEAVSEQMTIELNAASEVKLRKQLEGIESKIETLHAELTALND